MERVVLCTEDYYNPKCFRVGTYFKARIREHNIYITTTDNYTWRMDPETFRRYFRIISKKEATKLRH